MYGEVDHKLSEEMGFETAQGRGVSDRIIGCGRAFLILSLSLAARSLSYEMKSHLLYEWVIAIVART